MMVFKRGRWVLAGIISWGVGKYTFHLFPSSFVNFVFLLLNTRMRPAEPAGSFDSRHRISRLDPNDDERRAGYSNVNVAST